VFFLYRSSEVGCGCKYSITPIKRINWDRQASGYAEYADSSVSLGNRLYWQLKGQKNLYQQVLYAIYLFKKNKILIHNLYVFDKWGKIFAI
jgi:hypothetical protein